MLERAVLDTSAVIAGFAQVRWATVSVMTIAELRVGVLRAPTTALRAHRMQRLQAIEQAVEALPVDAAVAGEYARIAATLRENERTVRAIDTIIAATAAALHLPVVTSDPHFEPMAQLAGLDVVALS